MLLKETYYDRKAIEHWADEIISNKNFNLVVNGIEELICNPHPFTQFLHDAIRVAYNYSISCVHIPKNGENGLNHMIKNRNLYEAYPHPDRPVDLTVKGQNIKDILEYSYAYIEFNNEKLSLTIIDETLFTIWQGFKYTVDMKKEPFNRVQIYDLDMDQMYRITMTDYCYRNYKDYLHDATIHETHSETMGGLIRKNLKDNVYDIEVDHNFKVNY